MKSVIFSQSNTKRTYPCFALFSISENTRHYSHLAHNIHQDFYVDIAGDRVSFIYFQQLHALIVLDTATQPDIEYLNSEVLKCPLHIASISRSSMERLPSSFLRLQPKASGKSGLEIPFRVVPGISGRAQDISPNT